MGSLHRGTLSALLAFAALSSGCLERELKPLNPCLVSGVSRRVEVNNIDKVDMLFMVDNSNSMAEEQNALKQQFPKMIQVLTTGMRMANDPNPFPPAKDVHLAVVSSDMGAFGQPNVMGCDVNGGSDGRLLHNSSGAPGCQAQYPSFLSYIGGRDDPIQAATDFGCIAEIGTGGCGYEQQLESAFKAIWPSIYSDAKGDVVIPNPYTFLGPLPTGRGDLPAPEGAAGFIRSDPSIGMSLLAVVLVTDEEDCSAKDTSLFSSDPANPISMQGTQVRCFSNKPNLYEVNRYIEGFKKLRAGNEKLFVFAAIVGVPPNLVDERARQGVDFGNDSSRNAYYDRILNDRLMQETVIGGLRPEFASMAPSCQRRDRSGGVSTAFPPRRIVEVARGFAANGVVQSICQEDFGPAMDAIIEVIAKQLGAVCLPRAIVRKSDGFVPCNVVWELPRAGMSPTATPTDCSALPFLAPVDEGRPAVNERGGNNCKVEQLAVRGAAMPDGAGWYYDDFSPGVQSECANSERQRVAFSNSAKPATGIVVKLECLNETQKLPSTLKDVSTAAPQPQIGSSCRNVGTNNTEQRGMRGQAANGDAACIVALTRGTDNSMFCHPNLNVCVKSCQSSADCPPAWECDNRAETTADSNGKPFCVNPTCGLD